MDRAFWQNVAAGVIAILASAAILNIWDGIRGKVDWVRLVLGILSGAAIVGGLVALFVSMYLWERRSSDEPLTFKRWLKTSRSMHTTVWVAVSTVTVTMLVAVSFSPSGRGH